MKSILVNFAAVICLLTCSSILRAQGTVVKGGFNYTDLNEKGDIYYSEQETAETKAGYNFGLSFDLLAPEGEGWGLSLSPYFIHYVMDLRTHNSYRDTVYGYRLSSDFIHLPLNFKYLYGFSEWQTGLFAGMGPGFCVSDNTWSPFIVDYNLGLIAGYKRIIGEVAYSRIMFVNEKGDISHYKVHSLIFNIGYVIN